MIQITNDVINNTPTDFDLFVFTLNMTMGEVQIKILVLKIEQFYIRFVLIMD